MFDEILLSYGLDASDYKIEAFGSGLINKTYKLTINEEDYILQQINTDVFKRPEDIVNNLKLIEEFIKENNPDYLFVAPLPSPSGNFVVKSQSAKYYRLFPFVAGSHSVDTLESEKEALEAAKQFGRFTYLLRDFNVGLLEYPLQQFHDLSLRFDQFKSATKNAEALRLDQAKTEINEVYLHQQIVETYNGLVADKEIPIRVIHHDTKISNVLFNDDKKALCLVDLDTVMPGYYLSDVGDMMRTYLSPAGEEETDLSKIHVRVDFFEAIYHGYFSEMGGILTSKEKQHFIYAGKFMIYMQGLRFLTDFLNNDVYYGAKYPDHNLIRARNQFKLLNDYIHAEPLFDKIINNQLAYEPVDQK